MARLGKRWITHMMPAQALMWYALRPDVMSVHLLSHALTRGADPNLPKKDILPLNHLIALGCGEDYAEHQKKAVVLQEKLLRSGANPNLSDQYDYPLYHLLLQPLPYTLDIKDLIGIYLDKGARCDHKDELGRSALSYAIQFNPKGWIEDMLSEPTSDTMSLGFQWTQIKNPIESLLDAKVVWNTEVVKTLIERGAPKTSPLYWTAFDESTRECYLTDAPTGIFGQHALLIALASAGVNSPNGLEEITPSLSLIDTETFSNILLKAGTLAHPETFKNLLEMGADPAMQNIQGHSFDFGIKDKSTQDALMGLVKDHTVEPYTTVHKPPIGMRPTHSHSSRF